MTVLILHCCAEVFSSFSKWGLLFIAVCGLLITVASCCRAWALGSKAQELWFPGSGAQAQCLWCAGLAASRHVGSEPTSPALQSEMKSLSRIRLLVIPWTVAYQTLQSMEFSRQEYWSGSPFPSPGDLPNPGIEPGSLAPQADALPSEPPGKLHCKVYSWPLDHQGSPVVFIFWESDHL